MRSLQELLTNRREAVIERWMTAVRALLGLSAMPALELADHVPNFLEQIAAALGRASGATSSPAAGEHGSHRLRLGFSIGSVVREYGVLRECILAEAEAYRVPISPWEYRILFDCIITGISDAVSEYARQRDAELQRHLNEHFAFVAHELRNPLSTARMSLEVLRLRRQLPQNRPVENLERALRHTGEVVDHFLRVARIGSGIELQREPRSLRALLDEAILGAAPHAEDKGVRLSLELDGDEVVSWDRRYMQSALDNVVRNAVKFTPAEKAVVLRARTEDSRVLIEVEDSCGGVSDEYVTQAFNPFMQFNTDRSGFGLGLSIAKQAVEAHGGGIRIQNLPGKGCMTVLEVPIALGVTPNGGRSL